jgi:TonB family protein
MIKRVLLTLLLATSSLAEANARPWIPTRIQSLSYPILALQAQIQGKVTVRIKVNDSGLVAEARAISGHPILAKAALDNIKSWTFGALLADGPSTGTEMDFTYVFKLEGEALTTPPTDFVYEYPDKVMVTSKPLHWKP